MDLRLRKLNVAFAFYFIANMYISRVCVHVYVYVFVSTFVNNVHTYDYVLTCAF